MSAIRLEDGWVELDAGVVRRGDDAVGLTSIELRLLSFLAGRLGEVVGRDELLQEVWEYRAGVRSRTIDNTVRRIREKIERDPSAPVHLHVVYGRGLRLDATLGPASSTTPASPSFFGREREQAEIRGALDRGCRHLAVWGPAGAGKSRLVAELARAGGWIVVPLDGVSTLHEVQRRVAAALGVSPAAPGPIRFALSDRALSRGEEGVVVLVLDGCDTAVDLLGPLIGGWLADAPQLAIVVTLRPLVADGDAVPIAVGPLAEADAIALFCDRARLLTPGFRLEPAAHADLGRLLAAVDRLPLAVELAASRMAGMRIEQILVLVDRGVDVLGDGLGMQAMLHGSLGLLTAAQRRTLAQLSVFAAPFTLDDAEVVVGSGPVLDRVQALVDRALVHTADGRYALYRVVRDHVRAQTPPDHEVWRRHAVWFARWGARDRLVLVRRDLTERGRARAATPELLAVVERMWSDAPELAGRAALALLATYTTFGPFEAARELVRTLEGLECSDGLRGDLLVPACDIDLFAGGGRTTEIASRGLALSIELDTAFSLRAFRARAALNAGQESSAEQDLDWCAARLAHASPHRRGVYHLSRGEWLEHVPRLDEADEEYRLAGAAFREVGDVAGEAAALGMAATRAKANGDYARGSVAYREAVEKTIGWSERNEGITRMHWAVLERQRGDLDAATEQLAAAERLHRRVGNAPGLEVVRIEQALVLVQRGELEPANLLLEAGVRRAQGHMPNNATWLYAALGLVRYRLGNPDGARSALDVALHQATFARLWFAEACHQGLHALLLADDGDVEQARQRLAHGTALLDEAGNLTGSARLAAIRAVVEARTGGGMEAHRALQHARTLAAPFGLLPGSEILGWLREAEAALDHQSPLSAAQESRPT